MIGSKRQNQIINTFSVFFKNKSSPIVDPSLMQLHMSGKMAFVANTRLCHAA